jgi:two-component system, NtrC family, sensor kinase
MSAVRIHRRLMPRSLQGKSTLALLAMALLIATGGIAAVQALHASADASRSLAEERLEHMQDAQSLLQRTLLIERQSRLLLAAETSDALQTTYAKILSLLDSLDVLVARLGQTTSGTAILDLHQASQLFRFRRHAINRLQQVSHYLRLGSADDGRVLVPVYGDDEIGEMARAVEQFLEDRRLK